VCGSCTGRYIAGTHALFEDFLEALCRVADLKILPGPDEIEGRSIAEWYVVHRVWVCCRARVEHG
jgi:hypothetical protein